MRPSLLLFALCSAAAVGAAPLVPSAQQPWQGAHKIDLRPSPDLPLLSFRPDGTFKLAIVTDTHLLDNQLAPGNESEVNRATTEEVQRYLQRERPDFVVHNGDVISGEAANNTKNVEDAVAELFSPFVRAGVPFAVSHGNHDNDRYSTHASLARLERAVAPKLCYSRPAPPGVGGGRFGDEVGSDNYWVPIHASHNEARGSRPALLLWFLDSRSGHTTLDRGYEGVDSWVDPSVATWLNVTAGAMQRAWGTLPPAVIFTHIPNHYHLVAQSQAPFRAKLGGVTDERPGRFPGPKGDASRPHAGLNIDDPLDVQDKTASRDRAYLDALAFGPLGSSRIHGIHSGHDHAADWCSPSTLVTQRGQTVPLCMSKKSGSGGYDEPEWNHGSRVLSFNLSSVERAMRSYIRLQTGETRYDTIIDDAWAAQ